MKEIEITQEGIVIIQWLRKGDPQIGKELYNMIKHKEKERVNYFVKYYSVDSKEEFISAFKQLIDNTKEGTLYTLHIVSHGDEKRIGTEIGKNEVQWDELFYYTRQLNEIMGNNLLLILSSCVGGGIISHIEPEKRAPYRAIIGNTRGIFFDDVKQGFAAFYADFYNILDFPKALQALNAAIDFSGEIDPGRKKTPFFIMSAEESFSKVFNPDRDPDFFESVINRLMPPSPLIPQDVRIEKAKELFRKRGEELKPHYLFLD